MLPPIMVKNTTRIAGWLVRRAKQLAQQARTVRLPSKQEIRDGFILRGLRIKGEWYVAQLVDLPTFVLMPGFNRITATLTLFLPAVQVGTRDDLVIPDNGVDHTVTGTPGGYSPCLLQPTSSPSDLGPSPTNYAPSSAHSTQERALFGYGYFMAGLAQPAENLAFYALDDTNYFTFAEDCTVGGGLTAPSAAAAVISFSEAGVPSVGSLPNTYLNGAGLWITEQDLDEGWLLHPRRQVSHTTYMNVNDPYRTRAMPGMTNTGFLFTQAPALTLEGVDTYCVAARGYKQYVGTWFTSPPGTSYRPPYYDRDGEQALLIIRGHYDRADYTPGGAPALAQVDGIRYVLASTLPMEELRPYPPSIPANDWGRPELPAVGKFMTPWVGRTVDGYVVFSYYTTFLDHSDDSPSWEGNAHAIVISLPDGTDQVLFADLDGVDAPLTPGADPGELAVPTIIGGAVVPKLVSADPEPTYEDVSYCFVWEHTYNRLGVGDSQERGIGGRLVVYIAEGTSVTREVVTTAYAPLFASMFNRRPLRLDQLSYAVDSSNPPANVTWLGGSKVALAVVATPVYMPTSNTATSAPAHNVYVLIYDTELGTFEVTSEVFSRSQINRKCLLSAPRLDRETSGLPAVIMASVTDMTPTNRGVGKVYIRHADLGGPLPWREYITDLGGQGGAYYVGNKVWWFDVEQPLTTGGTQ